MPPDGRSDWSSLSVSLPLSVCLSVSVSVSVSLSLSLSLFVCLSLSVGRSVGWSVGRSLSLSLVSLCLSLPPSVPPSLSLSLNRQSVFYLVTGSAEVTLLICIEHSTTAFFSVLVYRLSPLAPVPLSGTWIYLPGTKSSALGKL